MKIYLYMEDEEIRQYPSVRVDNFKKLYTVAQMPQYETLVVLFLDVEIHVQRLVFQTYLLKHLEKLESKEEILSVLKNVVTDRWLQRGERGSGGGEKGETKLD